MVTSTLNQRTPEPLNELKQKLFKVIDDKNLEDFKQALKDHPED
jgi:hypothetical protein